MNYWLFKSEPSVFSFDDLKNKGKAGTQWDGVRNYAARNNMKAMQIGDLGFFYHSNEGLNIVGIAEVCKLAHPDTTTDDPRWECVDIRAVKDVPNPPTLEQIKAARVSLDFDGRYGSTTGAWTTDMFIEAVYRSLQNKK